MPPPQGGLGQSWFVLDFQHDYGAQPEPTIGGSGHPGAFGPAFATEQATFAFPGVVGLRRPVEAEPVTFVFAGAIAFQRRRTIVFAGQREPAERVVMARRDDEDALLLL